MNYKVLRGKNQIGGSIVEISTVTTRIFVDFGAELPGTEACSTDAEMIEIMTANPPDAIFFTHNHGDHIGLLYAVPDSVQIFMGWTAQQLMLNVRNTLLDVADLPAEEKTRLQKELDILESERVHFYKDGVTQTFGDIAYTPFCTDHSVCDAYMLLFKADNTTILHTGDFRTHGRLGENLLEDIKNKIANVPIDVLITEGTMMSRQNEEVLTERELEKKAIQLLRKNKYAFLICSSTNMESLASFYRAMIITGRERWKRAQRKSDVPVQVKPPFMVNGYVKKQLDVFTREVGEKKDKAEFKFYRSYVIQNEMHQSLNNGKTQKEHLLEHGFVMVVGTSDYYRTLMEQFREENPVLIYSLWDGYLHKGKPYANEKLIELVEAWGENCVHLHTSGHITAKELGKVIELINPQEAIVPIHTEAAEKFQDILPENLAAKVVLN